MSRQLTNCTECVLYIISYIISTAGTAFSNAFFGPGTGLISLDDVQCSSSSSQLLECFSRPILSHNCLHSADAGVRCESKMLLPWFYHEDKLI